jgi:hypothetical protein
VRSFIICTIRLILSHVLHDRELDRLVCFGSNFNHKTTNSLDIWRGSRLIARPQTHPQNNTKNPLTIRVTQKFRPTILVIKSHDNSVGIALGYGLDVRVPGFDSWRGLGNFLFTTASRTALGPTKPPIQCVPGALALAVKRPGREANHSPQSSSEVKE